MGRPRQFPATKTRSQSVTASNDRFFGRGGRIITVRLPPAAVERLEKIRKRKDMPKATSALVVHLIMQAPIRNKAIAVPPEQEKRGMETK